VTADTETFLERCDRERAEAGLPRYVEDEVALDKLITIVLAEEARLARVGSAG
jgi:hypothetical protein